MSIPQEHLVNLYDGTEFNRLVYTGKEIQGITVLVVISFISLVAIVGLLCAISISAFNTRSSGEQYLFVRSHVAAYFICLLLCDAMQAMGSIVNIRWIQRMGIEAGDTCTFQGVLKQASDVGTALWILVIAVHTFCIIFLELQVRTYVMWFTLVGGWAAIISLVIVGPATARGSFFGISGYWCWISPPYKIERLMLDYLVMFLVAFFSMVLYILIFLRMKGNIIRNGWRVRFRRTSQASTGSWRGRKFADDQAMAIARKMLLYPIAYTILILPISIARFATWAGQNVPFEVTIFTAAIFLLSGLVNVILFATTRRVLPTKSFKIGKWSISQPHQLPPAANENGIDPYYTASQTKGHSRNDSNASSEGSTVVGSSDGHSIKQPRKARPTDIIIRRESVESMYSVYEEEELEIPPVHVQRSALQPPPLSSVWSPDGSPQRRSWRY